MTEVVKRFDKSKVAATHASIVLDMFDALRYPERHEDYWNEEPTPVGVSVAPTHVHIIKDPAVSPKDKAQAVLYQFQVVTKFLFEGKQPQQLPRNFYDRTRTFMNGVYTKQQFKDFTVDAQGEAMALDEALPGRSVIRQMVEVTLSPHFNRQRARSPLLETYITAQYRQDPAYPRFSDGLVALGVTALDGTGSVPTIEQ